MAAPTNEAQAAGSRPPQSKAEKPPHIFILDLFHSTAIKVGSSGFDPYNKEWLLKPDYTDLKTTKIIIFFLYEVNSDPAI